jgi:hypothetical protein
VTFDNKLGKIVKTMRLKILKNVKIQWISILEPLKQVKYKALIVKMSQDNPSIAQAR